MTKFNFSGWNIGEWAKANKSNLRLIIAGALGLLGTMLGNTPALAATCGALIAAVSKLVLDSFDYFVSK